MGVLAIKTEQRCKLCRHPKRGAIDELLELRSLGKKDEAGRRVNADYVLERLAELGVENPTLENIKTHWRKHCQLVSEEEAVERQQREEQRQRTMMELFERVLGRDWRDGPTPTPDQIIELRRLLYLHDLEQTVEAGGDVGLTHDHISKDLTEATRRRMNETQAELMRSLGGAIEMALTRGESDHELLEGEAEEAEYEALPSPDKSG